MKKLIGLFLLAFLGFFYSAEAQDDVTVSTLAGSAGVTGVANGKGTMARFTNLTGIAVDASGNVYVADMWNNLIRKMNPKGVVTTLAGSAGVTGSTNGKGSAASFNAPYEIVVDASGKVYVADSGNNLIRVVSPRGVVKTLAGSGLKGSADGKGKAASFNKPAGLALDSMGNLYVADQVNDLIRKITPGGEVTTLAGSAGVTGITNGNGTEATFTYPTGIAVDSSGNIYVSDLWNDLIRKISPAGVVTTLAGSGRNPGPGRVSDDGTGTQAFLRGPLGMVVDTFGNIYVGEATGNIRKITPGGVVTTVAGGSYRVPTGGAKPVFDSPNALAMNAKGDIYVAQSDVIGKITFRGVVTTQASSVAVGSTPTAGTGGSSPSKFVSRSTYPVNNCYGGYPQGVPKDSQRGTPLYVDYNINFTYQPENPKDSPKIAKFFTTFLNADAKAEGSGLSFVQAEGNNPNIRLYLTVSHDSTVPDHYSLSVRVSGATVDEGNSQNVSGVIFFTIDHAPFTYTDDGVGQIIEDAAKDVQNNLANGWSCQ